MGDISFDGEIPKNYDRYLGPILFSPYADDLADRLPAGLEDVLELACGTGILTRSLLNRLQPAARLIATDLSPQMLGYAEGRDGSSDRVQWRQADATALPFPDAAFDAAVCQFGVMFFPDKVAAMKGVRRVLRPGGSFLFNVWGRLEDNDLARVADRSLRELFSDDPPGFLSVPHGYYERGVIRSVLEEAGFQDVSIVEVARRIEGAPARDFAAGVINGSPIRSWLQERGETDFEGLIDKLAARIGQECGDPTRYARMSAIIVTAASR
jgi:ubiquinone/menaquinone biosynthesis C-methylase UbiE